MRADAPNLAEAAAAAIFSCNQPHPRQRPAVTGISGTRLLPALTVDRSNQDASETLSRPASPNRLRRARGGRKTSECRGLGPRSPRSALRKRCTSRPQERHKAPDSTCSQPQRPAPFRYPVRSGIASICEGDVHRKSTSCVRRRWDMMKATPHSQSERPGHDSRLSTLDPTPQATAAGIIAGTPEGTASIRNTTRCPAQLPTTQHGARSFSPTNSPKTATITAAASESAQRWVSPRQPESRVGHDRSSTVEKEPRLRPLQIGDAR